jgi:NAD(P)-dependent dehydrogenase (short-subunit alcohol dehydrogenase family)
MNVDGASVLVTGGASGLGEATVRRLAAAGAWVFLLDRDGDRAKAVASEFGERGAYAAVDVTNADQVAEAVEQAAAIAPLRAAINCAGIGIAMRTIDRNNNPHDLGAFQLVLNVNLIGTFNAMRYAASAMAKLDPTEDGERGVIINTASIAAYDGQIGQLAYSASKGAVVGMTLPAARDLAAVGVRVCTIAPGTFDTPLLGMMDDTMRAALSSGIPFPKRLGHPNDYAALAEHIITNSYLNGETIRIDGALRMPPK